MQFALSLAEHLSMTVSKMLQEMSDAEFIYWQETMRMRNQKSKA